MAKKFDTPKKRLQWFLGFSNLNINTLPNDKLFGVWTELRSILYGPLGVLVITDEYLVKWNESRAKLEKIQNELRKCLERILHLYEQSLQGYVRPVFSEPDEIEETHKFVEEKGLSGFTSVVRDIVSARLKNQNIPERAKRFIAYSLYFEKDILVCGERVFILQAKAEKVALQEFLNSLKEFPLSLIQRCQREDCKGYFLKSTKKEKRYCSNKCAWVMAQRRRRQGIQHKPIKDS